MLVSLTSQQNKSPISLTRSHGSHFDDTACVGVLRLNRTDPPQEPYIMGDSVVEVDEGHRFRLYRATFGGQRA